MMKRLFLTLILTCSFIFSGHAQNFRSDISKRGGTAAPFLEIGMGARATAMGSAFVAVADDPSAIYWNPAGLASLEGIQVTFDHTQWLADVSYNFVAMSYNTGDLGTIGFSFTSSSYGDMEVTTIDEQEGNGQVFGATDAVFSVGYALYLTDKFSIGFNPKLIYQSIWNTSATAIAIDLGVLYVTPFDDMLLGMSISNFGTEMKLEGRSANIIYDPDLQNSGNNGKIPASVNTDTYPLPLNFKLGLSYMAFRNETQSLLISAEAAHPNNDYESINTGLEYGYGDFLFLRGGFRSMFLEDKEQGLNLGVGLKQLVAGNIKVQIDYAYADFGRLTNVQKFTLSLNF